MARAINDSVVVVTGASSGIGRATALALAREGAAVVLAARRGELLEALAAECVGAGGQALAVPTDVTDQAMVRALADQAVARFGRIDVWVNNAGVYGLGRFEEIPDEAFRPRRRATRPSGWPARSWPAPAGPVAASASWVAPAAR